jgi:hypothetical protein
MDLESISLEDLKEEFMDLVRASNLRFEAIERVVNLHSCRLHEKSNTDVCNGCDEDWPCRTLRVIVGEEVETYDV